MAIDDQQAILEHGKQHWPSDETIVEQSWLQIDGTGSRWLVQVEREELCFMPFVQRMLLLVCFPRAATVAGQRELACWAMLRSLPDNDAEPPPLTAADSVFTDRLLEGARVFEVDNPDSIELSKDVEEIAWLVPRQRPKAYVHPPLNRAPTRCKPRGYRY